MIGFKGLHIVDFFVGPGVSHMRHVTADEKKQKKKKKKERKQEGKFSGDWGGHTRATWTRKYQRSSLSHATPSKLSAL